MLEDEWPGLLPMALGATLIQARHRQSARRFENIRPMRIMTLNAIHSALQNRMALRQLEFHVRLQMTLKARVRLSARVDNEFPPSTSGFDMFASRAVARFATGTACQARSFKMEPAVSTRGKHSRDVGVALRADFIAHIGSAGNFRRSHYGAGDRAAGSQKKSKQTQTY
jgi:hypothetical protein